MSYAADARSNAGNAQTASIRRCGRSTALTAALFLSSAVLTLQPAAAREPYPSSIDELLAKGAEYMSGSFGSTKTAPKDGGRVLAQKSQSWTGTTTPAPKQRRAPEVKDPRAGSKDYEQAQRLMRAIDAILKDAAENRSDARKLPSKDDFLVTPIWTETKEDREQKIKDLLDAALGIVTDAPVVDVQKRIEKLRKNIRDLDDRIVSLREKRLVAPEDGMLPGILTDTKSSLKDSIEDAKKRIAENKKEIAKAKDEIHTAMTRAGVNLTAEQIDLLLESVLSGDLVRLVATFKAAKVIDAQLGKLVGQSGDNLSASRKYFAMHAALFAMLKHAQDTIIGKIDNQYLPKLKAIEKDIAKARARTKRLLRGSNRPDQRRALRANQESQRLARAAARGYRKYLLQQREQIARARRRATHDLNIADNTFDTVEASFQLRNLMRDSTTSFEALQRLEAPTFDQIFRNEELRKEFENLTKQLEVPTG